MARCIMPMALIAVLASGTSSAQDREDPLEGLRTQIGGVLSKLELAPKDRDAAEQSLQRELSRVVDPYAAKLRPQKGSKRYVSPDKAFVLVIAANGTDGDRATDGDGASAEAEDKHARLVVAIAGNGSSGQENRRSGFGGSARAKAPNGIAVALGGRGGVGSRVSGGGGGGGASAEGNVGSIGLGGEGGRAMGGSGSGGAGGGTGIQDPKAIVHELQKLKKR